MYRHILPNCLSTILVQLTLDVAYAILDLSALSFLGLGVGEPTADWGAMLGVGRNYLVQNTYLALAPGAMIVLTVVSLNLCSDGLHQYLDKNQTALPSFSAVERREAKRRAKRQTAAR
jgi:peptide/nickel transport system permease protein